MLAFLRDRERRGLRRIATVEVLIERELLSFDVTYWWFGDDGNDADIVDVTKRGSQNLSSFNEGFRVSWWS
ncbi:unnamed protein product [Dovyalis caffra]|uniref:Uncharacterized protein n=1 Tax=Dovyalis caffra TaxID=77055 RepID=A0AAV1RDR6_9ROSI|nr:unnamed protein product [Dovyalis caffra]